MREIFVYEKDGQCPVEMFLKSADKKIQDKFKYQMDYIKDEHNQLIEPHIKHFSLERYRQMYEMRIKAAGKMVRVMFYECAGKIVLLYAFHKRNYKDTEKALEAGLKILNSLLKNNGEINENYIKAVCI